MNPGTRIVIAGLVIVALASAGFGVHLLWTRERMLAAYGETPGIFTVLHSETDAEVCERVEAASPPAHFSWRGEIWQEPHLLWEDVEIRARLYPHREDTITPGKAGPVAIGDIVCGLPKGRTLVWIHTPSGAIMSTKGAYT